MLRLSSRVVGRAVEKEEQEEESWAAKYLGFIK